MPWTTSNRRAELPANWPAIRQAVIARDRGICQQCGDPGTDVDHIHGKHDHRLENLQLLCGRGSRNDCHGRKTQAQANTARPRQKRAPERHPGLL